MQHHAENGVFPLDFQKVDWMMGRLLRPDLIPPADTGTRGVIGVIGPVGALEAVVALVISSAWYTSERCLNDLVMFVDPEYRQSNHSKALLEWMKYQSTIAGIKVISGVVTTHRTEAKVRLYQRQMPTKLGAYFIYDPKASVVTSSGTGVEGYAEAV
jgi:hypothetical protein